MQSARPYSYAALLGLLVVADWYRPTSTTPVVDFEVTEGTNLAFDISPDGKTIVFDLLGQLWLVPSEGGRARPLTDAVRDTAEDVDPVFSPNGRWIVFQADRPAGKGLWLVPVEGGKARRLTPRDLYFDQYTHLQPTWSRDSLHVVYALGNTVYRLDVATGSTTRVPVDPPDGATRLAGIGTPAFSPDGANLAFGTGAHRAFRLSVAENARLWEAPSSGGPARPLTRAEQRAVTPAYSPDGATLAFFAPDSSARWQVWVQRRNGTEARQLTSHEDMAIRRLRWTPDGTDLVYSADGKLWRISAEEGSAREIPFTARVRFERPAYTPSTMRFPEPASERPARGFYGVALSPEGNRIAMLALGKLWVWPIDGSPRAISDVPDGAYHLSWSGDGGEVVFTTGDLFAADVETGALRRLTMLPGMEGFPAWSPDGRYIAFIHWGRDLPRAERNRVRLIRADGDAVDDLSAAADLGRAPRSYWGRDEPIWRPDSRALLLYGTDGQGTTSATLVSVDGESREAEALPSSSSFLSWPATDSIVYIHGVRLWKAAYHPDSGLSGQATPVSEEPALYATAATDGTVLYVSDDGLHLYTSSGKTIRLGWPITYETAPAPASLLVRNVRVIDGSGEPPTSPRDLLIQNGRIAHIGPTGSILVADSVHVLDAGGRHVMPGLIDLHQHLWTPHPPLEGGLYYGVTTVRDVGSSMAWSAAHRQFINSGLRPGPRIVLGGAFFLSGNGLSKDAGLFVGDSAEIARGIALAKGFGATYVKYYLDGWSNLTSIVDEAHRQGMRVSGHCASILPLVAAGIDGQEHTGACARDQGRIYEDYVRIKREAGIWVVADLGLSLLFLQLLDEPDTFTRPDIRQFLGGRDRLYDPEGISIARQNLYQRTWERRRSRTARLYNAGATLAVGTDLWFPTTMHTELEGLVAAGLSPVEAIAAATSVAARVLGAEAEIGTIEPGKLADLVILDADPSGDIANVWRVWHVIQGGRLVDRAALLESARSSEALASGPDYGY
ncbi:MAG: amidohydrolase family protein [Gemmatimonadales bacterium]|nr:amidohydrolase family protein [Gemmatimonadales bacterium]NIN13011.1 amidohydrolase family protein [Gemmatimonadales bacterium]NIN51088.1 amidohydrolase family protein [Gemmatimonadales bacterium]NIP08552.1 amidohydrolase family protein [Gemmatimonadales bacterium]NIR02270.1 amidohydrolase family protein [Gemmatimonadales bacterium]